MYILWWTSYLVPLPIYFCNLCRIDVSLFFFFFTGNMTIFRQLILYAIGRNIEQLSTLHECFIILVHNVQLNIVFLTHKITRNGISIFFTWSEGRCLAGKNKWRKGSGGCILFWCFSWILWLVWPCTLYVDSKIPEDEGTRFWGSQPGLHFVVMVKNRSWLKELSSALQAQQMNIKGWWVLSLKWQAG